MSEGSASPQSRIGEEDNEQSHYEDGHRVTVKEEFNQSYNDSEGGDVSDKEADTESQENAQETNQDDTADPSSETKEKSRSSSPVPNTNVTYDSDDEVSPKKRKPLIDSDDEEPDDGGEKTSPEKKKKVLIESDEDSDNEGDDKNAIQRKLLGSDVSDSEDDESRPRGQEEVGELMANIFGDDSDDEGGNKGESAPQEDDDDDPGVERTYKEDRDDEPGFEWDFDVMLRDKKAERKKKRRKRNDGIDIINDDDGTIAAMVEAMKAATKEDRISNMERKPALKKRKMLPEVKTMLLRVDMAEALIDNGMLSAVSDWLSPLPDKSLPALEIRTELLKLLLGFTRLEQSVLKQSGLGKAVMMLYKHPRETKENKEMASRLIREWARPIFQLDTDFRSLSKDERVQRDLDHMPQIKKRRMSNDGGPSGSQGSSIQDSLKPGDKGYIGRARVPRPSTKDYVVRPKSTVEGEFKGERKGKAFNRLDKTQREFMERTRKHKAKRAVTVSLEGRNLAI